jgi:hypothetical protein
MQCEEVREQLAADVASGSDPGSNAELSQHLLTCASCRAEAEEIQSLWASMKSLTTPEPEPDARRRFNLMIEAYRHGLEQAPSRSLWQGVNAWIGAWWPHQPALQFGLAVSLFTVGLLAGVVLRPTPTPVVQQRDVVADMRSELMEMRQMVTLSLMQQQSASERLRGVNWSYRLQQPGQEVLSALLDALMHDPNVNVRLATVDALRQFGDQPVVRKGVIEAMTQQESPMVQVALIGLAVDLHEKESVATLRHLSDDTRVDVAVRERAQKGLAELE